MITASEVYGVFGTDASRREVMMRKLVPRAQGDGPGIPALLWGTRFEPIAKRIYEERTNCSITDVSCVQHPIHAFLGASPDGLIVCEDRKRYGRLVEFKCPISRKPTEEIPAGYVHQMQMQMECTGIDECEYVEFRFRQVNYNEWAKSTDPKGFFHVYEDSRVEYDTDATGEDYQTIYWVLGSIQEKFVPRDPTWMSRHLDGLRAFWDEVVEHRKNGTLPEEKKSSNPSLDL